MSTRRTRPVPAAARRPVRRDARRAWWLRCPPWAFAIPALAAETTHLAAGYVEWPDAATRGAFHVVAGAALGLLGVWLVFGATPVQQAAGAALAALPTLCWLAGAVAGASPYRDVPIGVAGALALAELALAALLALRARRLGISSG